MIGLMRVLASAPLRGKLQTPLFPFTPEGALMDEDRETQLRHQAMITALITALSTLLEDERLRDQLPAIGRRLNALRLHAETSSNFDSEELAAVIAGVSTVTTGLGLEDRAL